MNRRLRRIIIYIAMTALYTILGFSVLYIAGEPLASYVIAKTKLAITNGAPGTIREYTSDITELGMDREEGAAFDQSEIKVPEPGTRYASMECKRVDLFAPVYYGDSDTAFENGAGQYPMSGLPGEGRPILIGGHDGTFFAPLEQLVPGDMIKLTTEYGSFDYKVTEVRIADAKDTTAYDLTQQKEQLILYTCYPFGQLVGDRRNRYYVYCDILSVNNVVK
jgi:sortase A